LKPKYSSPPAPRILGSLIVRFLSVLPLTVILVPALRKSSLTGGPQGSSASSPAETRRNARQAALCLAEALKFHGQEELPPESAFFCEASRAAYRANPANYARTRLRELQALLPAPAGHAETDAEQSPVPAALVLDPAVLNFGGYPLDQLAGMLPADRDGALFEDTAAEVHHAQGNHPRLNDHPDRVGVACIQDDAAGLPAPFHRLLLQGQILCAAVPQQLIHQPFGRGDAQAAGIGYLSASQRTSLADDIENDPPVAIRIVYMAETSVLHALLSIRKDRPLKLVRFEPIIGYQARHMQAGIPKNE